MPSLVMCGYDTGHGGWPVFGQRRLALTKCIVIIIYQTPSLPLTIEIMISENDDNDGRPLRRKQLDCCTYCRKEIPTQLYVLSWCKLVWGWSIYCITLNFRDTKILLICYLGHFCTTNAQIFLHRFSAVIHFLNNQSPVDYIQGTSALFRCFLGCSCMHQWGSLWNVGGFLLSH